MLKKGTQTCLCSLLQLLLRRVEVVDVGGVVLAVVDLHDLPGDGGLQGFVVVGQRREGVLLPRAVRGARGCGEGAGGARSKQQPCSKHDLLRKVVGNRGVSCWCAFNSTKRPTKRPLTFIIKLFL